MLIRGCEVEGARCDVRVDAAGGSIAEIAPTLAAAAGEPVIEARGGALLPGLNDHHAHLFAAAAALRSVRCGPPHVRGAAALAAALSSAPTGHDGWVRGVAYHESVAGELDRHALDRIEPARPVRVQHRTGALWVLNSAVSTQGPTRPGSREMERGRRRGGCSGWMRGFAIASRDRRRARIPHPAASRRPPYATSRSATPAAGSRA